MSTNLRQAKRVRHLVGTGVNSSVVSLPDVYGSIGSIVGVVKLEGDPPDGAGGGEVSDLTRNGQAVRLEDVL